METVQQRPLAPRVEAEAEAVRLDPQEPEKVAQTMAAQVRKAEAEAEGQTAEQVPRELPEVSSQEAREEKARVELVVEPEVERTQMVL